MADKPQIRASKPKEKAYDMLQRFLGAVAQQPLAKIAKPILDVGGVADAARMPGSVPSGEEMAMGTMGGTLGRSGLLRGTPPGNLGKPAPGFLSESTSFRNRAPYAAPPEKLPSTRQVIERGHRNDRIERGLSRTAERTSQLPARRKNLEQSLMTDDIGSRQSQRDNRKNLLHSLRTDDSTFPSRTAMMQENAAARRPDNFGRYASETPPVGYNRGPVEPSMMSSHQTVGPQIEYLDPDVADYMNPNQSPLNPMTSEGQRRIRFMRGNR